LYKPHNTEDLQKFYDRYLKGIENDWEKTAPVRLTLLSFNGKDIVERPEQEYPLARQKLETFYLDASTMSLSPDQPKASAVATYEAHHLEDCSVSFRLH
jgi:predicted acyl esterase